MKKIIYVIFFALISLTPVLALEGAAAEEDRPVHVFVRLYEDASGNQVPDYREVAREILHDYDALILANDGQFDLLRVLAKKVYKDGYTLLHHAGILGGGDTSVAKLLIENRASIDAQDENGHTPLHMAVDTAQTEFVKLLLAHNADMSIQDIFEQSPLKLALYKGYQNTHAGYLPIIEIMAAAITFRGEQLKHTKFLCFGDHKKCREAAKLGKKIALKYLGQPSDMKDIPDDKYVEMKLFLDTLSK